MAWPLCGGQTIVDLAVEQLAFSEVAVLGPKSRREDGVAPVEELVDGGVEPCTGELEAWTSCE